MPRVYQGADQIGLARAVTDRATYAYLCDVYVLESWGPGPGDLVDRLSAEAPGPSGPPQTPVGHAGRPSVVPAIWFVPAPNPSAHLEKRDPDIYKRPPADRISSP